MPPPASPPDESIGPALQQVLDDLNPSPAYILGRRYDYLAWNRTADYIFTISEKQAGYERNLIWRLFTSETMRAFPRWEQLARNSLAEFRTAHARYPGDPLFEELIEDLKQISPEFRQWWPQHDARGALEGHKIIEHVWLGRLEFEHFTLQIMSNSDVRLTIYSPDAATRTKLQHQLDAPAVESRA